MKKVTLELIVDEIDNENIKSIEDDIRIELSNCYYNIEISSYKEVDYDPRWIRVKDREPVVATNSAQKMSISDMITTVQQRLPLWHGILSGMT